MILNWLTFGISISFCLGFNSLPNLPGYVTTNFADHHVSSSELQRPYTYHSRIQKSGVSIPRIYSNFAHLSDEKRQLAENMKLAFIRAGVERQVKTLSAEVSAVRKQLADIANNPEIDIQERRKAINQITQKYPQVAPTILNLIAKIHGYNL